MNSQEHHDLLCRATANLIDAAETLIDGAGDETPDEMGYMGLEVWAKDFDHLKSEAKKAAELLAEENDNRSAT